MNAYERSIINRALGDVPAEPVAVIFKAGRGKISINPQKFLPCTISDARTLCTALDTAEDDSGAAALVDYSRRCVEALRELRVKYSAGCHKAIAPECSALIKRYTAAANFLAGRYNLDKIEADAEAVEMKRCTVYAMRTTPSHEQYIEQFDGWKFEKFGHAFTAYKYGRRRFVVLVPSTGCEIASATTQREIPAAITRETVAIMKKNGEKIKEFQKKMLELLPTACREIDGVKQHIEITPADIFGEEITPEETAAPEAPAEEMPETVAEKTPEEARPAEKAEPKKEQKKTAPAHKMTIADLRRSVEIMLADFDDRTGNKGAASVLSDPEAWTGTAGQFMKFYGEAARILLVCDSVTKKAEKAA